MIWKSTDGGIETKVLVQWGYVPETKLSVKWKQVSNGQFIGIDRGAIEDKYLTTVTFRGPFNEFSDLQTFLDNNQKNFLIACEKGEEIFGADINYSEDLTVAIIHYGEYRQIGLNYYEFTAVLRLVTAPFLDVTASLSDLRLNGFNHLETEYYSNDVVFTYDNDVTHYDEGSESTIFEGLFSQTTDELAKIRKYFRTTRTDTFILQAFNNPLYPFGVSAGLGPHAVKLIEYNELGRQNLNEWAVRMRFSRVGEPS